MDQTVTKHSIASITAQVYDILGLFSPFIIVAQIILQQLLVDKVGWDETVSTSIQLRWKAWTDDLGDTL